LYKYQRTQKPITIILLSTNVEYGVVGYLLQNETPEYGSKTRFVKALMNIDLWNEY
jgi:hypothetical protein